MGDDRFAQRTQVEERLEVGSTIFFVPIVEDSVYNNCLLQVNYPARKGN
jgi:hypothetical protein